VSTPRTDREVDFAGHRYLCLYPRRGYGAAVSEHFARKLEEELNAARKALEEIAEFGKRNPGYGFSCRAMANKALYVQ